MQYALTIFKKNFSLLNAFAVVVILFTYIIIFILQIDKLLFRFTTKIISKYIIFITSHCRANGGNKIFFFDIFVFIF